MRPGGVQPGLFINITAMCMSLFKKKVPRKWEFDKTPVVNWKATNTIHNMDPVTVCKIILTKILNINDIQLEVFTNDKVVSKFDTDDIEMQAILDGHPDFNHYSLHLRSTVSPFDLLSILCHEMVHLKQYHEKNLKLEGTTFFWKGKEYKNVNYWQRPWEIEARQEQKTIEKQLKELYYE